MSPTGRALEKAFEHPDDWVLDIYTATHKSGIRLWTNGGPFFFNTRPQYLLRFWEKFYLWYRFWHMVNAKIADQIHKESGK